MVQASDNFNNVEQAINNRFFAMLIAARWAHQIQSGERYSEPQDESSHTKADKPTVLAVQALQHRENLPTETLEILSPSNNAPLDFSSLLSFSKDFL